MAGSVIVTGLRELDQSIERFPAALTQALKNTAHVSALRIMNNAKSMLRSNTHGTGRTADAIRVLDESDHKQWIVNSPGTPDKPANLPLWLEYGTRFMTAKPHMRPAGDAENDRYVAAMTATYEQTATKVLAA